MIGEHKEPDLADNFKALRERVNRTLGGPIVTGVDCADFGRSLGVAVEINGRTFARYFPAHDRSLFSLEIHDEIVEWIEGMKWKAEVTSLLQDVRDRLTALAASEARIT